MDNPETLATLGTLKQDEAKQNTTQKTKKKSNMDLHQKQDANPCAREE